MAVISSIGSELVASYSLAVGFGGSVLIWCEMRELGASFLSWRLPLEIHKCCPVRIFAVVPVPPKSGTIQIPDMEAMEPYGT